MRPADPVPGRLVRLAKGPKGWLVVAQVEGDRIVCDRFEDLALAKPRGRVTIERPMWADTVRSG